MKPSFKEQLKDVRFDLAELRQKYKVLTQNYTKLLGKAHTATKNTVRYRALIYAMSHHLGPYSEGQLTTEERTLLYDVKDALGEGPYERWWIEEVSPEKKLELLDEDEEWQDDEDDVDPFDPWENKQQIWK